MANKIALRGSPVQEEQTVAAAFTPGMLLEITSAGKFQKHATPGGFAYPLFALEDELQGKEISDAYVIDTQAQAGWFNRGDKVNALLANGENAAKGSKLESNGDGYLKVVVADSSAATIEVQSVVAIARVALDMSGSSAADPASQRIEVSIV